MLGVGFTATDNGNNKIGYVGVCAADICEIGGEGCDGLGLSLVVEVEGVSLCTLW